MVLIHISTEEPFQDALEPFSLLETCLPSRPLNRACHEAATRNERGGRRWNRRANGKAQGLDMLVATLQRYHDS